MVSPCGLAVGDEEGWGGVRATAVGAVGAAVWLGIGGVDGEMEGGAVAGRGGGGREGHGGNGGGASL